MVKRYSRGQIWEFIIVVSIILIVLYRFLLVYDFVPDAYQPSTIIYNIYDTFKYGLSVESSKNDILGHSAKWLLDEIKAIEKYMREQDERYKRTEEVAKRCQENLLFRYFMYLGDEDNPSCTESNLGLKHAVNEIYNRPDTPETPATTSESNQSNTTQQPATAPNPQVTAPPSGTLPGSVSNIGNPMGAQPVSVTEPQAAPAVSQPEPIVAPQVPAASPQAPAVSTPAPNTAPQAP